MTATLTLTAALLLGLAASGHCLVMCGGISAALGVATAKGAGGRSRPILLVSYQFGRIAAYTLAGLAVGGALGGVVGLLDDDEESVHDAACLMVTVSAPGPGRWRRRRSPVAPIECIRRVRFLDRCRAGR